jgi:uncharacterized protein (TIGR03067 family)
MKPYYLLLLLAIGCTTSKKGFAPSSLMGTWHPVSEEIGGTQLPKRAFEKQTLEIRDSSYIVRAESVDKGVVHYQKTKMDIYGKEGVNKGRHLTAIYKLENNQLIICYNLAGTPYPESFDTKGKKAYFLAVYEKQTTNP